MSTETAAKPVAKTRSVAPLAPHAGEWGMAYCLPSVLASCLRFNAR